MHRPNRFFIGGCSVILVALFAMNCNTDDPTNLGPSNNQQIFGEWRENELIRSGCDDANNTYRRPCDVCNTLTMKRDYSFELTNDDKDLITQGTFTVRNETDITFDPGIFDSEGVSSVRYRLFTGTMEFSYTDENTLCAVIESYVVSSGSAGGN